MDLFLHFPLTHSMGFFFWKVQLLMFKLLWVIYSKHTMRTKLPKWTIMFVYCTLSRTNSSAQYGNAHGWWGAGNERREFALRAHSTFLPPNIKNFKRWVASLAEKRNRVLCLFCRRWLVANQFGGQNLGVLDGLLAYVFFFGVNLAYEWPWPVHGGLHKPQLSAHESPYPLSTGKYLHLS